MPISLIEAVNSFNAVSSNTERGWRGLGEMESIETSFCCATSFPATVSDVGISESRFVPSPPRFAKMSGGNSGESESARSRRSHWHGDRRPGPRIAFLPECASDRQNMINASLSFPIIIRPRNFR